MLTAFLPTMVPWYRSSAGTPSGRCRPRGASYADKIRTHWPPILGDQANRPGRKFNWRFRETSMLVWLLQEQGQTCSVENPAM